MRNQIFLVLLTILVNHSIKVSCQEDYYTLLGITQNANEGEIKKAFKKQSVIHHPDKNQNDPEKAKAHFAKVVNAYEVLKDANKRRIYDVKGEKGIKDYESDQSSAESFKYRNMAYQDVYDKFYYRSRGRGGQYYYYYHNVDPEEEQIKKKPSNLFQGTTVIELTLETISQFYRRTTVWLLLFYRSTKREASMAVGPFKEAAFNNKGLFSTAAIDCDQNEELCEIEFEVTHTPFVACFRAGGGAEKILFTGNLNAAQLESFALQYIESDVSLVNSANIEEFENKSPSKKKVLMFTDLTSTSSLLKVLSIEYKQFFEFGEVLKGSKDLFEGWNIDTIPTLIVLTDAKNYLGYRYEGKYIKSRVVEFLSQFIDDPEVEKPIVPGVFNLTSDRLNEGICNELDSNLCAIYSGTDLKLLENLAYNYQKDPIKFVYANEKFSHEKVFGSKESDLYFVKGKRNRFTFYQKEYTYDSLSMFIDELIGGSIKFEALKTPIKAGILEENNKNKNEKEEL